MNYVKVSVCIPVYNGGSFISKTIESVLQQSFTDFELVIINNASNDNTMEIVRTFQDKRIQIYENETNIGFCNNWNRALELARGSYIKILPADDIVAENCLEKQVEILENHADVVIVGANRNVIDDEDKELFRPRKKSGKYSSKTVFLQSIRFGSNPIGEPGAVLFRREPIDKGVRFSDKNLFLIDLIFYLELLDYGNLYKLPEYLASFRVSKNSTSVNMIYKQAAHYNSFIRMLIDSKKYQTTVFDYYFGIFMSYVMNMLRFVLYKIHL
jgi:glycosyltransferase involved in cell wall biosynthesis